MTSYENLLQDTVSFNRGVNLTRKIFKSKKRIMLGVLSNIYKKPSQLDTFHCVDIECNVPSKSQRSYSVKQSRFRGSVVSNRGMKREINRNFKFNMNNRTGLSHCDQTLAETKENYETDLLFIANGGSKEEASDIYQFSDNIKVISNPVMGLGDKVDHCPSGIETVTAVNSFRGNLHRSNNPFSGAIEAADQLLADLWKTGLITVQPSGVSSFSITTNVTTSQSNFSSR